MVGEIVNYPADWLRSIDAVMNFTLRELLLGLARGEIEPARANRLMAGLVQDAGIEPLLKSWVVIDNHDIPRINTQLPDIAQRRLVQALQFLLPARTESLLRRRSRHDRRGRPREPRADALGPAARRQPGAGLGEEAGGAAQAHRALRIGDYRAIDSQRLFAFERHTDRALETRIVITNPSQQTVRERLLVANAHLMDDTPMVDLLGLVDKTVPSGIGPGFITVELPPQGVLVLQPQPKALGGYSRYKRVP